jgi:gamma-glutamylcyclotransferase (GGCT)/AIG2-like uncharacterized protein YtfP
MGESIVGNRIMLVFVYGSLKRGFNNNWYLENSKFICNDMTEPKWDMINLGAFPGVIDGSYNIYGEVYEIDDDTLKMLDQLEGHPTLYIRRTVKLTKIKSPVWMYIFNDYELYDYDWDKIQQVGNVLIWRG